MPRAYSADLRERVITDREAGLGRAAAGRRYHLGGRPVYRRLAEARHEGRRAAKPHAGGPRPRIAGSEEVLRQLVATRNDATLAEQAESGMRRAPAAASSAPRPRAGRSGGSG